VAAPIALSIISDCSSTATNKTTRAGVDRGILLLRFRHPDAKRLPRKIQKASGGFASRQCKQAPGIRRPPRLSLLPATTRPLSYSTVFKDERRQGPTFQFNVRGSEREYDMWTWKRRDYTPNEGLSVNVANSESPPTS